MPPRRAPPARLALREDLRTRLALGLVFEVIPLADADKPQALAAFARERGFRLSDDVIAYLLAHGRRDMPSLVATLAALDRHSLATQRGITVPLLREWLQRELWIGRPVSRRRNGQVLDGHGRAPIARDVNGVANRGVNGVDARVPTSFPNFPLVTPKEFSTMNKLLIALVAGTFAATAWGQGAAPAPAATRLRQLPLLPPPHKPHPPPRPAGRDRKPTRRKSLRRSTSTARRR